MLLSPIFQSISNVIKIPIPLLTLSSHLTPPPVPSPPAFLLDFDSSEFSDFVSVLIMFFFCSVHLYQLSKLNTYNFDRFDAWFWFIIVSFYKIYNWMEFRIRLEILVPSGMICDCGAISRR